MDRKENKTMKRIYNPDNHGAKMDEAMQIMSEQCSNALFSTCKNNRYGSIAGTSA